MTPESPSVVPETVGNAFVERYYNQLYEKPSEAHRFYLEGSVLGRVGPDGNMVYAKSLKEINDQIMSIDYKNSKIQILTADSQESFNKGVLTLVMGLVITKDGKRTKFSQSFFLVPQNGSYFVLNDSFRYVSDESAEPEATKSAQVAESTDVISEPADETVGVVIIPSEAETAVTKTQSSLANGHAIDHKEKVVNETANLPEAAEAKPQENAPRRSYALIVKSLAQNGGQFTAKVSPAKPKHVEKPRVAAPELKAPDSKAPAPKASSPRERPSAETNGKAGPGSAIFVAKLPMDATAEQLYETFKDFGAIRTNGIQVKSYAETRNCIGFVAFESGEAAKTVLQAHKKSAILIGNRRVNIEEKRGNNNNNGGRPYERNNNYYKNENGYKNDGYRPRGNGFNGGRGNGRNGVERVNGDAAGDVKASQKNGHGKAHAKN